MERDIFVRSKWTTFKAGHKYSGKTTEMICSIWYTNRNFCNFVLNGEFLGILMTLTDCRRSIKENILPFVIFHPMKALGELMLPLKSLSPNKFTQKLHQWLFHRHYNNVVTIIIITVSIILLQLHPCAIAIIIKKKCYLCKSLFIEKVRLAYPANHPKLLIRNK